MHTFIDKLAWIHLFDGRVLSTRSKGKVLFYLPGGKREPGESDHTALIREIQEELSVSILPESLKLLGIFEAQADGKPAGTMVRMTCYTGEFHGTLAPASEIEEMAWLNYADKARTSAVDHLIFDWLRDGGDLD